MTDEELASIDALLNDLPLLGVHRSCIDQLIAEARRLRAALTAISTIRDSIVGMQRINWSEHVYPLVAVLDDVGFVGVGYHASRENLGTLLERARSAEAERDALRAASATLARVVNGQPLPPDTVAVPRWLLVSILAYGLSDDDVERLSALLKEERERLGVPR